MGLGSNENGKVLASTIPSEGPAGEAEVKAGQPLYKRKSCMVCCGVGIAILLAVIVLIIILIFTVFKVRNPTITIDGMRLDKISVSSNLLALDVTLDLDLHLLVAVHNPNHASFGYSNSTTYLYYHGQQVGQAAIPSGKVGAEKTVNIETDLNIANLVIKYDANLTSDIQQGIIPVSTYSKVNGRVNVINIFKHHAVSISACDANIWIVNATLKNFTCAYSVKL